MDTQKPNQPTQERLIGDLRLVIENAEELLKNTDHYAGFLYRDARARLALALDEANAELARFEDAQLSRMIDATNAACSADADTSGEARIMRAFVN
jgi:ElaB/YqjD/DUF883 family membrane-anchored ribosome-binding protein